MKTLAELCRFLSLDCRGVQADLAIHHLTDDSREVVPQTAFLAYPGVQGDGCRYIAEALERGAKVIFFDETPEALLHVQKNIADKAILLPVKNLKEKAARLARFFYDDPTKNLHVIAVTGTNGKTSTTHYLAQLLTALGKKTAVLGTVGNGIWGELVKSPLTTLGAVKLQQLLREFADAGVEYVVMEASSHGLDQGRLDGVNIESALFLNLTQDHLDYHQTMASYANAKAKLFQFPGLKNAVINLDDPYASTMIAAVRLNVPVFTFSMQQATASLFADIKTRAAGSMQIQLFSEWGEGEICLPLIGDFNVSNVAAALTCLAALQFEFHRLLQLAASLQPIKGRMECLRLPGLPLVIIDFAHTPDALKNALANIRPFMGSDGRLIVVFGCGGERDPGKRPQMAAIAEKFADVVMVSEDNSRREPIEKIFQDIRLGFNEPAKVTFIEDRKEAVFQALQLARPNDIVILAGKGHEDYRDKNGVKTHFDEREVVAEYHLKHSVH